MRAVATIVGEMCEVFRSTPYFHIGGDEADLALADQNVDFKAAMKKYDLPNQHELYRRFLCQMDEIVKHHGKQMIVWEGFGRQGRVPIPKDIVVMSYEIRFYMPHDLLKDGYQVINASWTPLYVVNANAPAARGDLRLASCCSSSRSARSRRTRAIIVPPSRQPARRAAVRLGAARGVRDAQHERKRLPAMIERIWNPDGRPQLPRLRASAVGLRPAAGPALSRRP